MPGKYSHGAVLATYSSRGVISLPNDVHLEYLNSTGSAPSGKPLGTRSRCSTTSRAAEHNTNKDSINSSTWHQHQLASATNHPQLDGGSSGGASRMKQRKIIIDSDDETTDAHTTRISNRISSNVPHRIADGTEHSPSLRAGSATPVSAQQADASEQRASSSTSKFAPATKTTPRQVSALAAQKYELRADSGRLTRLQGLQPSSAPPSETSSGVDSAEPLFSLHEFLGNTPDSTVPHQHQSASQNASAIVQSPARADPLRPSWSSTAREATKFAPAQPSQPSARAQQSQSRTEERATPRMPSSSQVYSDVQMLADHRDMQVVRTDDIDRRTRGPVPLEPDFTDFSSDEGLDETMDVSTYDTHSYRTSHAPNGNSGLSGNIGTNVPPPTPPLSPRGNQSRPPWSSASLESKVVASHSYQPSESESFTLDDGSASEKAPMPQDLRSTAGPNHVRKQILALKSEEEMRLKLPTPIPSPTISIGGSLVAAPAAKKSLSRRSVTPTTSFGVPSIVRTPPKEQQKQTGMQKPLNKVKAPATMKPPKPPLSNIGSTRNLDENHHNRSQASLNMPVPLRRMLSTMPDNSIGRTFDFRSEPSSRVITPRPPRITTEHQANTSQWEAGVDRSLVSVFDDISSMSTMSHGDYSESDADRDEMNHRLTHAGLHNDPEAAAAPPDITRYSPRRPNTAIRIASSHDDSSPLRRKGHRKFRHEPGNTKEADEARTVVPSLPTRRASQGPGGISGLADQSRQTSVPAGQPRDSRSARVEALLQKADEEARANKRMTMKGVWGRLKGRV